MYEVAIIGGGILGLSVAYQLSRQGRSIAIVDRPLSQNQASWAAAGLLPPANLAQAPDAYERLRAYSRETLTVWCEVLRTQTGIDAELRTRGAIHVARTKGESAALSASAAQWQQEGIQVEPLDELRGTQLEPALQQGLQRGLWHAAYFLPDEATVRPPRLLKALQQACRQQGVRFLSEEVGHWEIKKNEGLARLSTGEPLRADSYCICSGAWSERHLRQCGLNAEIIPWRGQMLLYKLDPVALRRVIYEGPNYIVPRDDGLVLVGATMEEVGFGDEVTAAARRRLEEFAWTLIPELAHAELIRQWAGFRPGTVDGFPLLGRIEPLTNIYVATGHFRSGIAMSAGSAVVLDDLMQGRAPQVDVSVFRPNR